MAKALPINNNRKKLIIIFKNIVSLINRALNIIKQGTNNPHQNKKILITRRSVGNKVSDLKIFNRSFSNSCLRIINLITKFKKKINSYTCKCSSIRYC